ncbi:MAG TPA: hypothetical protein VH186_22180 [Chloroflexia bacterium]|nr:hypothetical protein [Chloroflexia bacterium]
MYEQADWQTRLGWYLRHHILASILRLLPVILAVGLLHDLLARLHPFDLALFLSWVPLTPGPDWNIGLLVLGLPLTGWLTTLACQRLTWEIPAILADAAALPEVEARMKKVAEVSESRQNLLEEYKAKYRAEEAAKRGLVGELRDMLAKLETVERKEQTYQRKIQEHESTIEGLRRELQQAREQLHKAEQLCQSAEERKSREIVEVLQRAISPVKAELELQLSRLGPKSANRMPTGSGPVGNSPGENSRASADGRNSTSGPGAKPKAPGIPTVGPAPSPVQRH